MKKMMSLAWCLFSLLMCNPAWSGQVTPNGKIGDISYVTLSSSSIDGTCKISQFGANTLNNPMTASSKIDKSGYCLVGVGDKPLFDELSMCFISNFESPYFGGRAMARESVSVGGGVLKNPFFEWTDGTSVTWNCFIK